MLKLVDGVEDAVERDSASADRQSVEELASVFLRSLDQANDAPPPKDATAPAAAGPTELVPGTPLDYLRATFPNVYDSVIFAFGRSKNPNEIAAKALEEHQTRTFNLFVPPSLPPSLPSFFLSLVYLPSFCLSLNNSICSVEARVVSQGLCRQV